jgi:hypothetical protein
VVKISLREKAERIRSEQALRSGESPDNVLHSAEQIEAMRLVSATAVAAAD